MTFRSFRARLAATMGAVIVLIAAAFWIYLPRKLEEEAVALITHKAETLAQLTAFTIHPALFFQDHAALAEALSGTRADRDVSYIVVLDPDGRILAAHHPERATREALARSVSGGRVSQDRSMYEVMMPIRDRDRLLARLHIGTSLSRLNAQLRETRLRIGLFSAAVLLAGLLLVGLLSNVLTRPLREVAAGAGRLAAGDLTHRVSAGNRDEIQQLAAAFNEMAEKIAERDASLRRSRDQLREMSKRLLTVQEQERVRIAREVHDELGQALTAMKIDLQQLAREGPALHEPVAALGARIDEIVDLVRRIASDLRPAVLDDLGVTAALEQQLRRLRESTGLRTTLSVEQEPDLDMLTGVTLYRIAQEALSNIVRHAKASEVNVTLTSRAGSVVLGIEDDGVGVTREKIEDRRSLGLTGMRERAELLGGTVQIEGRNGEGTVLTVTLPVAEH